MYCSLFFVVLDHIYPDAGMWPWKSRELSRFLKTATGDVKEQEKTNSRGQSPDNVTLRQGF